MPTMLSYLHDNPLVLAALISACALFIVMLARSLTSLLFLRTLRNTAPDFWRDKLGGMSVGLARFAHLTPARVSRIVPDPTVLAVCRRLAMPFRVLFAATCVLFTATVALLIASGFRGR
jgi:hypothetical protein